MEMYLLLLFLIISPIESLIQSFMFLLSVFDSIFLTLVALNEPNPIKKIIK